MFRPYSPLDARSAFREDRGVEEELGERASAPKRVALAALLTIVGLNVWTGGPLLALWVGSRVQGSGPPTMGAVFVVVVVLAAVCLALAAVFARLNQTYQDMTGQVSTVRQHTPWLRSMRGERPQYQGVEPTLTTPERILVGMVVVAFVLFEIWFFFFSGSPIDNRTGRSAVPAAQARSTGETRNSFGVPGALSFFAFPTSKPPSSSAAHATSDTSTCCGFAASTTRAAMLTSTPR